MSHGKQYLPLTIRSLVSLSLLTLVLSYVDVRRLYLLFSRISAPYFLIGLMLITLERILLAHKWNLLLAKRNIRIPLIQLLKIYYSSNFLASFLPSSLSVEIVRTYSLARYTSKPTESISSVLVDKIAGLGALLLLGLVSVIVFATSATNLTVLPLTIGITVAFAGFLSVLLNRCSVRFLLRNCERFGSGHLTTLTATAHKIYDALIEYMEYTPTLLYVFFLSLSIQVVRVFDVYAASLSLGQEVRIVYFFLYVPIIMILTMLPLSLAGIGIREGAFVYLFAEAGMTLSDAVAVSLLVYVLTIISILPGAIVYLVEGTPSRGDTETSRGKTDVYGGPRIR